MDYGAANRFGFDDPQKWVTVPSVPLLDEHEMTGEDGRPVARVDRAALQEIADNNNKRVYQTGDPATLILGHTSDDPRAPEKPAVGFVTNYRVKPFKRSPDGQIIYAIHGDYKVRPQNAKLLEEYPRRSVELWWNKRELDPIAMLGGSSPERDLGVVIRNGRMNHVSLGASPRSSAVRGSSTNSQEEVIRFSTRGNYTVETYSISQPRSKKSVTSHKKSRTRTEGNMPKKYNADCGNPMQYDDGGMNTDDLNDYDGGDEAVPDDNTDGGDEDPLVAKVQQSKWAKGLESKLDMILQAVTGGAGGEQPGMDGMGGMGGEEMPPEMPPPGGGGMGQAPPPGAEAMGDEPPPEEEMDERRMHGQQPVQMDAYGSAYPGPTDVSVPGPVSSKRRMSRNGNSIMNRTVKSNPTEARLRALEAENKELKKKYARADAATIVRDLAAENIRFGRDEREHAEGMAEETEYIAELLMDRNGEKDVNHYVNNVVRKRFARSRPNPAQPSAPGVSRFSRQQTPAPAAKEQSDEEFEDTVLEGDPQLVSQMVDAQLKFQRQGLPQDKARTEAVKFMRKRLGR